MTFLYRNLFLYYCVYCHFPKLCQPLPKHPDRKLYIWSNICYLFSERLLNLDQIVLKPYFSILNFINFRGKTRITRDYNWGIILRKLSCVKGDLLRFKGQTPSHPTLNNMQHDVANHVTVTLHVTTTVSSTRYYKVRCIQTFFKQKTVPVVEVREATGSRRWV